MSKPDRTPFERAMQSLGDGQAPGVPSAYRDLNHRIAQLEAERNQAVALLRAWVAGCGDERYCASDECQELLHRSGDFLARLGNA